MAEGTSLPKRKSGWVVGAVLLLVVAGGFALASALRDAPAPERRATGFARKVRPHFDHAPVISGPFATPQAVTHRCLECHPRAAEVMRSSHFQWLGEEVEVLGHAGKTRIGKKNLLNNFCIATSGNERSCM